MQFIRSWIDVDNELHFMSDFQSHFAHTNEHENNCEHVNLVSQLFCTTNLTKITLIVILNGPRNVLKQHIFHYPFGLKFKKKHNDHIKLSVKAIITENYDIFLAAFKIGLIWPMGFVCCPFYSTEKHLNLNIITKGSCNLLQWCCQGKYHSKLK